MKAFLQFFSLAFLSALLLAGCGGGGDSSSPSGSPSPGSPQTGALDSGGAGLSLEQVSDGQGGTVSANFSAAVDINDALKVIGYAEIVPGSPFAAALWTVDASGSTSVAPAALASLTSGGFAAAFALDGASSPVGQANNGGRLVAVLWKNGVGLPAVLPQLAGTGNSAAYAVSADGSLIVGEAADATGAPRAVIWSRNTNGNFTAAPAVLPVTAFASGGDLSRFSSASGVARAGAREILVAGEAVDGTGTLHAVLWRSVNGGTSFSAIDLGEDHAAYAVNSARQVAGENDLSLAPVSWSVSDQGVATAPVALAAAGSAQAINNNGRIAGWSGVSPRASVWLGTAATTLFSTESQAYGLNNEVQPLVVGRVGNQGFVKRVN
jgi:uncharacterized membrane protein